MADNTKIEWADASLNPLRARNRETGKIGHYCEHASPGCINCYSETFNQRGIGAGVKFQRQNREKIELYLDEKTLTQPLRWKRGRTIFWCSMTDAFAEFVTDEQLDRMFAVATLTPQHRHLFLTKRADRMRQYFLGEERYRDVHPLEDRYAAIDKAMDEIAPAHWHKRELQDYSDEGLPIPNVLLGFSAEDQPRLEERWKSAGQLAELGWRVFLSAEPLLGPLDLTRVELAPDGKRRAGIRVNILTGKHHESGVTTPGFKLSWVIVGGEGGHGARDMELRWAHDIVSPCQTAKVPVFVKQIGSRPVVSGQRYTHPYVGTPIDRPSTGKGGDMGEWPYSIRVREVPA